MLESIFSKNFLGKNHEALNCRKTNYSPRIVCSFVFIYQHVAFGWMYLLLLFSNITKETFKNIVLLLTL